MGDPHSLPPRHGLGRRPRRRPLAALRRRPLGAWALTLVAGALTYLGVDGALTAVSEGAEAYGDLVTVVVARSDLAPGDPIDAAHVELTALPSRLVPADALDSVPVGRSAREPILAGEALAARRLAPDGAVGVAAELGDGEQAVAIPTDPHRAPFAERQRVDVLATTDPGLVPGRSPTRVVAEGARVLDVADGGITVAVRRGEAAEVATALATSVITVAVTPS